MIRLTRRLAGGRPQKTLTLPLDKRTRSRLRVTLDDGTDAGLFLERGRALRDGDLLGSDDGTVVQIRAADEPVSSVYCDDPLLLARACYHLGNRHVPLQIQAGLLRYQHDHVLDELVRGFGLTPRFEKAPFHPESGAYEGDHGHGHAEPHDHAH